MRISGKEMEFEKMEFEKGSSTRWTGMSIKKSPENVPII